MKKLLLTLAILLGVASCSPNDTLNNDLSGIVTAELRGLKDGTSGVNCNDFVYPSDIKFYTPYKGTEKISPLDVVLNELKGVYRGVGFRWYPKNGKFQAFLSIDGLSSNILYGLDENGEGMQYDLGDDIFRIRITGIDNDYSEEFCFNPTSYVTAIYINEKKIPDGEFEVEFLDYTQYGIGKFNFSKPSF